MPFFISVASLGGVNLNVSGGMGAFSVSEIRAAVVVMTMGFGGDAGLFEPCGPGGVAPFGPGPIPGIVMTVFT